MSIDLLSRLAAIVGPTHVLTEAGEVAPHAEDWRGRYRGVPLAVVRPADAAQVAAVVAQRSEASCSTQPLFGKCCGNSCWATARTVMSAPNRIARVDVVP